jgi:hypothetical protein
LKRVYHELFRGPGAFRAKLAAAQAEFQSPGARILLDFVADTKRGLCADGRIPSAGKRESSGDAD